MTTEKQKLPCGVRFLAGRFRWETSFKGKRVSGSADTLEQAVLDRGQALKALQIGDRALMPAKALRKASATHEHKHQKREYHSVNTSDYPKENLEDTVPTLLQMVQYLMQTEWKEAKSLRTIYLNANGVLDFFGPNTPLTSLTSKRIDEFTTFLVKKLNANGTVNRKLAIISKVLKKAEQKGYIDRVPYIQRLPESEGRVRFLTLEEEGELLTLLTHWGYEAARDAVIVLIDTGIRTGELYKLCIDDVDFGRGNNGIITLNDTKNGSSRSVPLTNRAKEALTRLIQASNDHEQILPKGNTWLRNIWDRAKRALGKEDDEYYVPHILRHTCCSRLVQKGAPLKKVQAWMGHKTITTTMRYAHLCPDDLYSMTDLLEDRP